MKNKRFSLNHKLDYCLMNNYENNFDNNEWDNDYILALDDNIPFNDDYNNEKTLNKKYSFIKQNGVTYNKYK